LNEAPGLHCSCRAEAFRVFTGAPLGRGKGKGKKYFLKLSVYVAGICGNPAFPEMPRQLRK